MHARLHFLGPMDDLIIGGPWYSIQTAMLQEQLFLTDLFPLAVERPAALQDAADLGG